MTKSTKTWIYVLIAVFAFLGISAIGLVVGSAYWISRHVSAQVTSSEDAATEFSRERARFAGQQPLVELSGGDNFRVRKPEPTPGAPAKEITTIHARIYDSSEGKVVRVDIPFWLIRAVNSLTFVSGMDKVTLEDVERRGPGLIVNGQGDDGEEILVWAE